MIKPGNKYFFAFAFLFFLLFRTAQAQDVGKFELNEINFSGNSFYSDAELRAAIVSKESPGWFSQFLYSFSNLGEAPVLFDSLKIPLDEQNIRKLYFENGFFMVKVSHKIKIDTVRKYVYLTYFIQEGVRHRFAKTIVKGLRNINVKLFNKIKGIVNFDTASFYSAPKVEQSERQAITLLQDNGFMLAKADKPFVKVDTIKNKAQVSFLFHAGRRYKIGKIKISKKGPGGKLVSDDLLKKIVNIKTGEYYSNFNITQAQIRLYRTNLFSSALVSAIVSDSVDSTVPLLISADVDKMYGIAPQIIANNEDNAFNLGLGIEFSRKNFLGNARKLALNASAAGQDIWNFLKNASLADTTLQGYSDAHLTIEQPFLFGKPINTKFETYFTLQKRRNEYNSKIFGANLALNFELPRYTYFTGLKTYFNWENAQYIYQRSYISNNLRLSFLRQFGNSNVNVDSLVNYFMNNILKDNKFFTTNTLLGIKINANHTNSMFFPTNGYSLSLILENGNSIPYLISKIRGARFAKPQYFKAIAEVSYFPKLFFKKTSAFGIKLKVGDIYVAQGNKADISINQRLYAGGSNSIRGWGSRELVPEESPINITAPTTDFNSVLLRGISPGGFALIEGSFELRQRLIGHLGYAIFTDYGNTWNSFSEIQLNSFAVAVGFGLRFYTDFVPLRLDFAFKFFDPKDRRNLIVRLNDRGGFWNIFQFHLGIGEAF